MPLICPYCEFINRLTATYCGACSRYLVTRFVCSNCGFTEDSSQSFCNKCGLESRESMPKIENHLALGSPTPRDEVDGATLDVADVFRADRTWGKLWSAGVIPGIPNAMTLGIGITVLMVAMWLRLYQIGYFPEGFNVAEIMYTREGTGWAWGDLFVDQQARVSWIFQTWMTLFSDTAVAPRVLSGLVGLVSLGLFFAWSCSIWGRRTAILGTLVMAVSFWHVTYSRLALPVSLVLLIELLAIYAMHRGLRNGANQYWLVAAGLLTGAVVYLDAVGMIFVFAIFAVWGCDFLRGKIPFRVVTGTFTLFAAPVAVFIVMYLGGLAVSTDIRDSELSVSVTRSSEYASVDGVMDQLRFVVRNNGDNVSSVIWNRPGHRSANYTGRMLDPVTGLLVAGGICIALIYCSKPYHLFLVMVLGVSVVGVGLTTSEGAFSRLMITAPVIYVLAGLTLDRFVLWSQGRLKPYAVGEVIVFVLLVVTYLNATTYLENRNGSSPDLWVGELRIGDDVG